MSWLLIKKFNKNFSHNVDIISGNRRVDYGDTVIIENFSSRFVADKCIYSDNRNAVIIDGVILNKRELLDEYGVASLSEWIKMRIGENKPLCLSLRGPFSGAVIDKNNETLYAFGNQTGDTAVFYYAGTDCFAASSDFNMVYGWCRANDRKLSFSAIAAKHMMTFGYLVDGATFVTEIKKAFPGNCVSVLGNGGIAETPYHRFDNHTALNISIDEAVEMLDTAFRKSVSRCFDKDIEYGYKHHLVDMSGGLDCRMVSVVARDMGYSNITNMHYSKKDSTEEKCAYAMSCALKNEFISKPLDDLTFFYDIDEIIGKNYGLAYYAGITGGNRLLGSINFDKFGLEHTGQLGDVVIGTYNKQSKHTPPNPVIISVSDFFDACLDLPDWLDNHELFAMYLRGFQGVLTTHFIRRNYTEAVSPYIDLDFLELCLSIPLEFRYNHLLYWKWIDAKYPIAASVPSTRKRPSENKKLTVRKVLIRLIGKRKRQVAAILSRLGLHSVISDKNSMNPFDYWYGTNMELRKFVGEYFQNHIDLISKYPEIKQGLEKLINAERASDKFLALTVLGVYKKYFI
jgi:asparagine synthase (glutamine-hydrolysing)